MAEQLKIKGNDAFKKQDWNGAIEYYTKAIQKDSSNPVYYSNRAMTYLKLDNWEKTLEDANLGLQKSSKGAKVQVKLYWRKGLAQSSLHDYSGAKKSIDEALKLEPHNAVIKKDRELLDWKEKKYKRLQKQDRVLKKVSSVQSHKNKTKISIPVNVVNELPTEFKLLLECDKPVTQPVTQLNTRPNYPKIPTVYLLSQFTRCSEAEKPYAYEYLFDLEPISFKLLSSKAGIDAPIIDLILKVAIYQYKRVPESQWTVKILEILDILKDCPRFDISKLFYEQQYAVEVFQLLSKTKQYETEKQSLQKIWLD